MASVGVAVIDSTEFAGTFAGTYRSTDDGITWTDPDTSLTSNIEHIVVKDSVIYAGGGGLFRSTDDGRSWTTIVNGIESGPINGIVSVGTDLFVASGAGVMESTDGGNNRSTATGTGSVNDYTNCIAAYDSTILVGWVGGIIRSTDGGIGQVLKTRCILERFSALSWIAITRT